MVEHHASFAASGDLGQAFLFGRAGCVRVFEGQFEVGDGESAIAVEHFDLVVQDAAEPPAEADDIVGQVEFVGALRDEVGEDRLAEELNSE